MRISNYLFLLLFFLTACNRNERPWNHPSFNTETQHAAHAYDWNDILSSGELIVTTISGPDTYFDFRGIHMGLHYALVNHFAQKNGLRVRFELAHTVEEMSRMIKNAEADVICFPLEDTLITKYHLLRAGYENDSAKVSWAVGAGSSDLALALNEWYGAGIEVSVERTTKARMQMQHRARRKVRAPYISKEKGIISVYDDYFKSAARIVGWDWRLIAAQCYQESGFDPSAESWAGAKGLMQIMPASAEQLGLPLERIFNPSENIAAAAEYLKMLNGKFRDISHPAERTKFVLAAYNGGSGHVRDAMALAQKYGHNSKQWSEVAPFILKLSEPAYYRDSVVKYGYMIGSETYQYVYGIWGRWRAYGGKAGAMECMHFSGHGDEAVRKRKKNRFSKENKIYRPEDPEFNQLQTE